MVERICCSRKGKLLQAWQWIAETSAADQAMTSMYALGWTQHSKGSQNIRTMAMVQLLLGNTGVAGGGMNALRGHSNIQGLTDVGLMNNLLGLTDLTGREGGKQSHVPAEPRLQAAARRPAHPKFFISFPEFDVRRGSTADNDFCYEWLPKLDVVCDVLRAFELNVSGKINGYFC